MGGGTPLAVANDVRRCFADATREVDGRPVAGTVSIGVVITYDANGGFWVHMASPKGDRWGPGSRIPALIVSPFAKKGFVDHTLYDTTSILSLITRRFGLAFRL